MIDAQLAEIDCAVRQASARGLGWQTMTVLEGLDPSRYSIDELRSRMTSPARLE